jgi:hypothetical protein
VPSDGKWKLKTQTFRGSLYATEADVRRAVGAMVPHLSDGTPYTPPVAVTFGALLDRYIAEEVPARKSTRDQGMWLESRKGGAQAGVRAEYWLATA